MSKEAKMPIWSKTDSRRVGLSQTHTHTHTYGWIRPYSSLLVAEWDYPQIS